jgi:predicted kinase
VTSQPLDKGRAILQLGVGRPSVPPDGVSVVQAEHRDHGMAGVSEFERLVPVTHAMDATRRLTNGQPLAELRNVRSIRRVEQDGLPEGLRPAHAAIEDLHSCDAGPQSRQALVCRVGTIDAVEEIPRRGVCEHLVPIRQRGHRKGRRAPAPGRLHDSEPTSTGDLRTSGEAHARIRDVETATTRLVLICGLPASGKSTLARRLASEIPAIRLDKDAWVTALGADLWDDEFRERLEAQLWILSQDLLARGQSVILEWGHWARAERDEKRVGARRLGVGVELYFLNPPVEELFERAERRTASGEWTAAPITRAHFEEWATTFQPPDEEELLLFDTPLADG